MGLVQQSVIVAADAEIQGLFRLLELDFRLLFANQGLLQLHPGGKGALGREHSLLRPGQPLPGLGHGGVQGQSQLKAGLQIPGKGHKRQ